MEGKEGKTEKATPKRRNERREKGDLCISMEIVTMVSLLLGLIGIMVAMPRMNEGLTSLFEKILQIPVGPDVLWNASQLQSAFNDGSSLFFSMLSPIIATTMIGAVAANIMQTGPYFSTKALAPKMNMLHPVKNLSRLFSVQSLFGMAIAMLKVLLIVLVVFVFLKNRVFTIPALTQMSTSDSSSWIFHQILMMGLVVVSLFVFIAAIDYAYRHYTYERDMMMTKKEVEDDSKGQELPALVKGAQRRRMRDLTVSRMMAAVPNATVVITNPTHVAIALEYRPEKSAAPRVVAKGLRLVAERIKQIARDNNVPVIEKPELAREIYKHVKVGQVIPSRLFGAVADILAYLYRIGNDRIRKAINIKSPAEKS